MAITRIPEPYRAGLAKIKSLLMSDVDAISNALSGCPLSGGLKGMISAVHKEVPAIKPDDAEDIVRALYSLYSYRADSDAPLSKFIPELMAAMRKSGKDLILTDDEKAAYQEKITKLLGIDAVGLASKAERLRTDYANTFYDARIMTDIRPIFADPGDQPLGAAITHTLKIEYHQAGDHKHFYVSLDANDLELLRKAAERAELKAKSIQSMFTANRFADLSQEKSQ
jgi:hypothetical protein